VINYRFEVGVSEIQRLDLFLKDRLKKSAGQKFKKPSKRGR